MKLSYNWLSEFVKLDDIDPREAGLRLTMSTSEIENIEEVGGTLEGVVAGKILEVKRHPDSDHLFLTKVDVGKEVLPIVSGAPNTKENTFVPVALVGARLPDGLTVKRAKLRGVESLGLVCSERELGVSDDHSGLWILDDEGLPKSGLKPGAPLAGLFPLRDFIIEIDNKSITNRPDLWCHYGFARELAALYGRALKAVYPRSAIDELRGAGGAASGKGGSARIELENKDSILCPRYTAIMLGGIRIGKSPFWVRRRLYTLGVRPIYNIVDVTNYVMLEVGQPLHAFDAETIARSTIVVRRAREGERFKTLDGFERTLTSETLLITDPEKAVAVAGVMGGLNSEISDATKTIIVESANFNPASVRRTAVRLGLRTEASNRFEKSLDPELTLLGITGSVSMIKRLIPGARVVSPLADAYPSGGRTVELHLDSEWVGDLLGVPIEKKRVAEILGSLSFTVEDRGGRTLGVRVPSFRASKDVSIPQDLVEEVGRIYGYGNIEPRLPLVTSTPPHREEMVTFVRELKLLLSGALALSEVYTYSFQEDAVLSLFYPEGSRFVSLQNPVSTSMSRMRRSLVPGLFALIEKNAGFRGAMAVFEVGSIYDPEVKKQGKDAGLPSERRMASALLMRKAKRGEASSREGASSGAGVFFELKGKLEHLFQRLYLSNAEFTGFERGQEFGASFSLRNLGTAEGPTQPYNSARRTLLTSGRVCFGIMAELNPLLLKHAGIDFNSYRAAVFEMDLENLLEVYRESKPLKRYQRLPRFPEVLLDIAVVVGEEVPAREVKELILSCGTGSAVAKGGGRGGASAAALLNRVELFDIYRGKPLAAGKKSLAFNLSYGSDERTLTDEEVKSVHDGIVAGIRGRGWDLR
jgi:phenylalanyl-tRNA synthetase beta chain